MTIYFAANEFEAFTITNSGSWSISTTAGSYDSTICRGSMLCSNDGSATIKGTLSAAASSFWLSFDWYGAGGFATGNTGQVMVSLSDGTKNFLRIVGVGGNSSNLAFQKSSNGSSWSQIGSQFTLTQNTRLKLAIQVIISASGTFALYNGTTLLASSSEDTTVYAASCASFALGVQDTSGVTGWTTRYSQVMVSDVDNRNWKLKTVYPSGAGNDNAWTGGTAGNLNSSSPPTDASPMTSATINQVETFATTDAGANQYSAYSIKAVVTSERATADVNPPSKLDHVVRVGSTNYTSSDITPSTSFGPTQVVWATDPSTGAAWTYADFGASVQLGAKSIS